MGKILGVDFGEKSVGIAISDMDCTIAFPKTALKNGPGIFTEIARLCTAESVKEIILGKPLSGEGNPTEQTELVNIFYQELRKTANLPVILWDERFTTEEALALLKKKHTREDRDAISASLILESYMKTLG